MSVNTAHADSGVLIHAGETIILFSDNVTMEFNGQDGALFRGSKTGRIYLTTHRMIFNNRRQSDPMQSFSFPFVSMSQVEIEQPVFGANFLKGKVRAQENGQWTGEAKFKLLFKSGGAIDFGTAMLRAAHMARANAGNAPPPPYTPPGGAWYAAPPAAYGPPPTGYYGWMPQTQAFPNGPPPNSVFMIDNPPPYPGIVPGGASAPGYPNGGGGYPAQPPAYPGYPPQQPQPPPNGFQGGATAGYPHLPPGAMGFTAPPQPNTKEAEAAQSAYYDPNQPQTAYVPPPAYYEQPPSYNSLANKKSQ